MPQIHPRVTKTTADYLVEQSVNAEVPIGKVIDLIMERAQRLGWRISPAGAPVIRGGDSDSSRVPEEP